jgi:hypothetical protein
MKKKRRKRQRIDDTEEGKSHFNAGKNQGKQGKGNKQPLHGSKVEEKQHGPEKISSFITNENGIKAHLIHPVKFQRRRRYFDELDGVAQCA